jgi:hypothetical protein
MKRFRIRTRARAIALACACTWLGASAQVPRTLTRADEIAAKAAAIAVAARHKTSADRTASRELIAQGDAAYRRGQYDEAHRFYDNASPNFPSAYAYLMTGDSHWRASIAFGRKQTASGGATSCRLQRRHFVDDVRLDLNEDYLLGLRLSEIEEGHKLAGSPLLARAKDSAACLAQLADELAPQPAQTCVDEARIAACLGQPLLQ